MFHGFTGPQILHPTLEGGRSSTSPVYYSFPEALTLAFCLQPTDAVSIVPVPPQPRVRQTVTLSVRDVQNPTSCRWFVGHTIHPDNMIISFELGEGQKRGNASTGRESLARDCSLTIRNLEIPDTAPYFLTVTDSKGMSEALLFLRVSSK